MTLGSNPLPNNGETHCMRLTVLLFVIYEGTRRIRYINREISIR